MHRINQLSIKYLSEFIRHIEQDQFFKMLICVLVKIDLVIDFKPEKVFFYGIKWPVFLLQLKPDLKLVDCDVDRNTKTDIGTDYCSHQPFGVFLKVFSETDDVCLWQLPSVTVKVTFWDHNLNHVDMQAELLAIHMIFLQIRLFKHTLKHFILPGVITEIYRITVIVLKETFNVWLDGNCNIEFHRKKGFQEFMKPHWRQEIKCSYFWLPNNKFINC